MPWLVPDDDVRRLPADWVEFPVITARFVSWGVGLGMSAASFLLLGFVIPVGVLVVAVSWWFGVHRARDFNGWLLTGSAVGVSVLLLQGSLLHHFPWFIALLLSPVAGGLITKPLMTYVRYETPIRYWVESVRSEMRAPKATKPARMRWSA